MPFLFLTSSHSSVISKASSTQKMNIAAASGGENIHLNIYAQAKKSLCRLYFFLQRARLLNLTFYLNGTLGGALGAYQWDKSIFYHCQQGKE